MKTKSRFRHSIELLFVASLLCFSLYAEQAEPVVLPVSLERLPAIEILHPKDVLFKQYCDDVQLSYQLSARALPCELYFYRYTATKDDTLLTLSARLSLPYETLATANALSAIDTPLAGKTLVLPTVPGLFLPIKASSAYELMLQNAHQSRKDAPHFHIQGRECVFLQNERFTPTERAFFLDTNMIVPIEKHVLSSSFGYRVSPISGKWKFHSGVDLAAPTGTAVFACKTGIVTASVKQDATYGNYIILQHSGGMTSVYAHLSRIDVKEGMEVQRGAKIGEVGTTGASTGPHLHFEVRVNGSPTDPGQLLNVDESKKVR